MGLQGISLTLAEARVNCLEKKMPSKEMWKCVQCQSEPSCSLDSGTSEPGMGGLSVLLTRETEAPQHSLLKTDRATAPLHRHQRSSPQPLLFCFHFLILSILIKEMFPFLSSEMR